MQNAVGTKSRTARYWHGHYRQAAKRYFDVAACTRDATRQRADILTGLQTLMAGHHLQDAARASEQYFSVLRDDREALMFLTRLALASNHPELAEICCSIVATAHSPYALVTGERLMSFRGLVTVLTCCITATASATSRQRCIRRRLPPNPKSRSIKTVICWAIKPIWHAAICPAAYFVARKSSAQPSSTDVESLKRFAEVAESVRANPAKHWMRGCRLCTKSGDRAAWDAVGRLAGGLLNNRALLAYQQQLIQRMGARDELIDNIMQTYERLGNPREGLRFSDKLMAKQTTPKLLENASLLAERTGQDDRAIALLKQSLKQPSTAEEFGRCDWLRCIIIAVNLIRHGKPCITSKAKWAVKTANFGKSTPTFLGF